MFWGLGVLGFGGLGFKIFLLKFYRIFLQAHVLHEDEAMPTQGLPPCNVALELGPVISSENPPPCNSGLIGI